MQYITNTQTQILESLARFKYLTNGLISEIIGKGKNWVINSGTIPLKERDLIGVINFGVHPTTGKLPNIYFLRPKGVKMLVDDLHYDPEEIRHPKGQNIFAKDYFHRLETIKTHIGADAFIKSIDGELITFETYYDKIGSNRTDGSMTSTKLDLPDGSFIIPDGVLKYKKSDQSDVLFLLEVYKGKDTKRVIQQVRKLIYAIYNGVPSRKYNYDKSARLLLLFETEKALKSAITRIKQDEYLQQFEHLEKCIFSRDLDSIEKNFATHWVDLHFQSVVL